MYTKDLFPAWVPKVLQNILLFMLAIPLLVGSSIYTANMGDMYSGLGIYAETLTFANYSTTIGMMVGLGVILKIKPRFKSKNIIVFTFISLALLTLAIGSTQRTDIIVVCSVMMGFIKVFGMIELLAPIMFIISPKGDRGEFYAVFYPLILGSGQLVSYLTANLAYSLNWNAVYLVSAMILFGCSLLCIVLIHNKWTAKRMPIKGLDWFGIMTFTAACLLLNYILVFAKQQGWFYASMNLRFALAAFIICVALFIYRQRTAAIPFFSLAIFTRRSVLTAIVLFVLMGMFSATSSLQSALTSVLQYDARTNATINLAMIPGMILGGFFCAIWFKREGSTRSLLFIAFSCFLLHTICLYFLISPVVDIRYFILPTFFKGLGMALVYIGGGFYFASSLKPTELMGAYPVVIGIRSFIGTAFFSAVFSWGLYQFQSDSMMELANGMDAMDAWVQARGGGMQLYASVRTQSTLIAVKELFGYTALAGLLVLVYIALHPFHRLHRRQLIIRRKRFKGESIDGLRAASFDDKDITATAASVST